MVNQGSHADLEAFREMIVENEDLLEEPITIVRTSSQSATPDPMQGPAKPSTTNIPSTCCVVSMGVAAKMFAAGVLAAGDLVIEIRERLQESNLNVGGSQIADKIIYAGNEYVMVSRPDCQPFGAVKSSTGDDAAFYVVHLRRSNAPSDVAGL